LSGEDTVTTRVALLTDMHYADKAPAGTRHYRETLAKFEEAAKEFARPEARPDLLIELGDLVDAAESAAIELEYLRTINDRLSKVCAKRHYVLGNHCVDTLSKEEFLEHVKQQKSYYSFDEGGFHFVILDACFRTDGVPYGRKNFQWTDTQIPDNELSWLEADLKTTELPVLVFAHQRLDVNDNHGVKNNAVVRELLQSDGKVLAVFQGHSHQNDLKTIGGIPYCTLAAMVEGSGEANNSYSLLQLGSSGTVQLKGWRRQQSRAFQR
jgi:3',5'-cyclic AMP phosphodiesterase CpdA